MIVISISYRPENAIFVIQASLQDEYTLITTYSESNIKAS